MTEQLTLPVGRNPRWAIYERTHDEPTNWGFMAWITRSLAAFRKAHPDLGARALTDDEQDAFTAFLESEATA